MSREAELYKDKIEVSLDGRQIFYLFFGGAVIVGLVFVLGVMVGRRVEARGHVDRASVAATVDPLAALDRLEGSGGLSFQGSLRGGEAPPSDVEKQIAAMQKHDDKADKGKKTESPKAEAKADVKNEAKHDEPKLEAKKAEAKVDPLKPDAKKTEGKSEEPKVETKKTEAKGEEPKSEKKADGLKSDAKKVEAKADEPKLDAKKTEAKAEKKESKFTLQLSSFQDKNEAQAYLDSIKSAGYSAYVTEGAVDGKQYFRVRLGSYKSMDAAMEAKIEFEKSAKKIAIVTKL